MDFSKENRANTLNGVLFVTLFALSSFYLASIPWIANLGISSLVVAIVLGMIYSNTLRHRFPKEWEAGIQFSAKRLLRLAIILYGFRISFQQMASVGLEGLLIDSLIVFLTLLIGYGVGVKLLKMDPDLSLLIGAGAAICGAAAVLAVEDILKSEPYKATVAVATVVLFGTLSMFLYPFLQHLGFFNFSDNQFGVFAGATIHEVAQVVVAGNDINLEAGSVAVIVKMTRVLLLVPVLFILSILVNKTSKNEHKKKIVIPWFALIFLAMVAFNSLHVLQESVITLINQFDIFLLTMAMAAIGIETNFLKIKKVGIRPLYLAILLFIELFILGFWLVKSLV